MDLALTCCAGSDTNTQAARVADAIGAPYLANQLILANDHARVPCEAFKHHDIPAASGGSHPDAARLATRQIDDHATQAQVALLLGTPYITSQRRAHRARSSGR